MASDPKTSSKPEASCLERYRRIVYIVGFCAKICGANVADADFRLGWHTYIVLSVVFNFYCCTAYTIYIETTHDGDISDVLETCCFLGCGLQAGVKLVCFLVNQEKLRELHCFLDHTFVTYDARGDNYRRALSKGLLSTKRFFKLFMAINIGLAIAVTTVPIVYYVVYKEKLMLMQFSLPFLDPKTKIGFWLLTVIHTISLSFGGFGTFAADMYLLLYVGNIPLFKDILKCKLDDLNDLLDCELKPTKTELHASIVEVVVWHQNYLRLLNTANSMFFIIIFAYVVSCAVGIMSTLYCMLVGAWPAAPFLLIYSYASLYAYCGLGTIVDNSNNECIQLIYTQCPWYDLPVQQQRYILLMLRVSQTASSLTVGHMMPLNVATGLQLTKALFSMVMLLLGTQNV